MYIHSWNVVRNIMYSGFSYTGCKRIVKEEITCERQDVVVKLVLASCDSVSLFAVIPFSHCTGVHIYLEFE